MLCFMERWVKSQDCKCEVKGEGKARCMLPAIVASKENIADGSVMWDISGMVKRHHCPRTVHGRGQKGGRGK